MLKRKYIFHITMP